MSKSRNQPNGMTCGAPQEGGTIELVITRKGSAMPNKVSIPIGEGWSAARKRDEIVKFLNMEKQLSATASGDSSFIVVDTAGNLVDSIEVLRDSTKQTYAFTYPSIKRKTSLEGIIGGGGGPGHGFGIPGIADSPHPPGSVVIARPLASGLPMRVPYYPPHAPGQVHPGGVIIPGLRAIDTDD